MLDLNSKAVFSQQSQKVLSEGNILKEGETPFEMVERVVNEVYSIEKNYGIPRMEIESMKDDFANLILSKLVILGSPTMTNAGRNTKMTHSSCVAIPVDIKKPLAQVKQLIESYYKMNMGSGFDFTPSNDPCKLLEELNNHAKVLTQEQRYERYIGNMGNIDINHPKIIDFIRAKSVRSDIKHFNISVNISKEFMNRYSRREEFLLKNGEKVDASLLWNEIIYNAWYCGDPGLIFLERFNGDNPTPNVGKYITTAPCGEVGLTKGEACVFGYINVGKICQKYDDKVVINYDLLENITQQLTRALDNCLDISIHKYPSLYSKEVMSQKRKIGIGICGFADLLIKMRTPYGSDESLNILQNILQTINYTSKTTSLSLAEKRASFGAINNSKYITEKNFLSKRFEVEKKCRISKDHWSKLESEIYNKRLLRHASTTALPPSGRSALILDASNSIEPHFSLKDICGELHNSIKEILNDIDSYNYLSNINVLSKNNTAKSIGEDYFSFIKKTIEIPYKDQLRVVSTANKSIDEGISKTVNIPSESTVEDVSNIYTLSWETGLKGISIYRDSTKVNQPNSLKE